MTARHDTSAPPVAEDRPPLLRDPPPAAIASSSSDPVVESARAVLVLHRLDPEVGACASCGASSPCDEAQTAARRLVAAGAWNTLEFEPPARRLAAVGGPDPSTRSRRRWLDVVRRLVGMAGRA